MEFEIEFFLLYGSKFPYINLVPLSGIKNNLDEERIYV